MLAAQPKTREREITTACNVARLVIISWLFVYTTRTSVVKGKTGVFARGRRSSSPQIILDTKKQFQYSLQEKRIYHNEL